MIDNYDSFTYNLVQYFGELGAEVRGLPQRRDHPRRASPRMQPDRLVISPGPCSPAEAGISVAAIRHFAGQLPILGVCLGHQSIGAALGGKIVRAQELMHGKTSVITTTQEGVFAGLPKQFTVNRYHSLAIERATCPTCLEVTAWTDDGEIMGVRHRELADPGRAVPPRIDPDRARPRHAQELPRPGAEQTGVTPCPSPPSEALQRVIEHREIFHDEMLHLMRLIMSGELSPIMTAALIAGLRVKKETIGEITAAAQVMREFSVKVEVEVADRSHLVDIVGTGGDGAHTFNISTCAMFVIAAAGAKVSKHGGRSVSSKSGSADAIEALGIHLDLTPAQIAQCIAQTGIGFMFAPNHHPAMKNVAPVRRELGVRTLFNILGPLTNPAGAPNILLGVFHPDLVGILVRALQSLGAEHALVVHGKDGLDEISLGAATLVGELKDGVIREYEIHPEDFGFQMVGTRALQVENPEDSRAMLLGVLEGQAGPARDIVLLNAGAALYAADVAASIADGIALARQALDSGAAKAKLDQLVTVAHALSAA